MPQLSQWLSIIFHTFKSHKRFSNVLPAIPGLSSTEKEPETLRWARKGKANPSQEVRAMPLMNASPDLLLLIPLSWL